MRAILLLVIHSLYTAIPIVFAQEGKLSSEKHAQVESAITKFMAANGVPGLTAAIIENGEFEWSKGYGMADLENFVPATTFTCIAWPRYRSP